MCSAYVDIDTLISECITKALTTGQGVVSHVSVIYWIKVTNCCVTTTTINTIKSMTRSAAAIRKLKKRGHQP